MKNTCFICAMSSELAELDNLLGTEKTKYYEISTGTEISETQAIFIPSKKVGSSAMYACTKKGKSSLAVISEYKNNNAIINTAIGLENAFFSAQLLDLKKYDLFVNIGTAGAIDKDLKLGEILSVDTVSIIDNGRIHYFKLNNFNNSFKKGGVLSCKNFASPQEKRYYSELFDSQEMNMKAVDMELASLKQIVPHIMSFKIISDEFCEDYDSFCKKFPKFMRTKYPESAKKIFREIEQQNF
ncbi:MAG: hypothetical protein PHT91_03510 [Candidatus Nanoarchaeia archaeon]|nr:hypothetical protein [Candidatus Nanoarchaeia archaeon]MDD5054490.1 hypothetical protein [Candidatus Nanoarchaeia archaeon]MDD5499913.1 hypothetical protein [Candidatus Nanoarchaeia archaeon]